MPPEVTGATPPAPAPTAPPVKPPVKAPEKVLTPKDVDYDGSVYVAENAKWVPGKVVQYLDAGRGATAIVAVADGRLMSVKLSDIRHGVSEPNSLPTLHPTTPGGIRQHTVKLHHDGKWIVASPDGVIKGEFDTEDDAKARHAQCEAPPAPEPPKKGQWKEAG